MTRTSSKQVWAKLWKDNNTYNVPLNLEIRELWGQNSVPDDFAIERVTLLGGIAVEDGTYNLEYSFNGKEEKTTVRVSDGTLLSPLAA
jgi:hypothetical protein